VNLRSRALCTGHPVGERHGAETTWVSIRRGVVEHPDWFHLAAGIAPIPLITLMAPTCRRTHVWRSRSKSHYYEQTDAAVVCSEAGPGRPGETRYIYHGNDGTSFPWNDTAQLDYLKPRSTRAGDPGPFCMWHVLFPVIRFDAAMTLAKAPLFTGSGFPGPRQAAERFRPAPNNGHVQWRVQRTYAA